MFPRLHVTAALIAVLALGTPGLAQDAPSADTVMATVGETEITFGHMLALRAGLPQQYDQLPADVLFKGVLDQLIQQTLLMQADGAEMSLAGRLRLENESRAIMAAEHAEEAIGAALNDEALQAAYDARYADAAPETEYKAAHILVETEEEARKLVSELEGGANFAALAQEHSIGPSGPSGGDLGWFGAGVMVQEFFDAVTALEAGAISAPVQTQFGWHVIMLNETRTKERPSLDEVRDELADEIRRKAFEDLIAELTAAAEITRADTGAMDPAVINRTDLLEN